MRQDVPTHKAYIRKAGQQRIEERTNRKRQRRCRDRGCWPQLSFQSGSSGSVLIHLKVNGSWRCPILSAGTDRRGWHCKFFRACQVSHGPPPIALTAVFLCEEFWMINLEGVCYKNDSHNNLTQSVSLPLRKHWRSFRYTSLYMQFQKFFFA